MIPETLVTVLSAVLTALSGALVGSQLFRQAIDKLFHKAAPPKTYAERLSDLTGNLTKASSEVDAVLQEMARVAKEREVSVRELEGGLVNLEKREKELKEKIAVLQNVPIPVADYFAKLVEPVERRSAHRDYLLFISGVIMTTVIAIVLRKVFGI
jgi:hypothetical protein